MVKDGGENKLIRQRISTKTNSGAVSSLRRENHHNHQYHHPRSSSSSIILQVQQRSSSSSNLMVYLFIILLLMLSLSIISIWIGRTTTTTNNDATRNILSDYFFFSHPSSAAAAAAPPIRVTIKPNSSTLALLYPPGLLGGYRNQFIRFTSLVAYSTKERLSYLFLPSLLWTTTIVTKAASADENSNNNNDNNESSSLSQSHTVTIPMEYIFDIDAWNRYALNMAPQDNKQQEHHRQRLPIIVQEITDSDCWIPWNETDYYRQYHQEKPVADEPQNQQGERRTLSLSSDLYHPGKLQQATLERGTIGAIASLTQPLVVEQNVENKTLNARRMDLLKQAQKACNHPKVYGGGIMAGRLWNDHVNKYIDGKTGESNYPNNVDHEVLKALHPLPRWRQVSRDYCLGNDNDNYLALHARVELEMLAHPCGREMERNLTNILQYTETFLNNETANSNEEDNKGNVRTVFIAVWRDGIQDSRYLPKFATWAENNIQALDRYTTTTKQNSKEEATTTLLGGRYRVLECGTQMMDRYYVANPDVVNHGTLLEQVINFDLAVQARYFVGVAGSSYSTAVWTTRYYSGKGLTNYQYTPRGIVPVENDGLPNPHGNCKKRGK